ncbi:hypothetical protein [Flavobacterium agrisoli]|uniref:Uncharacterized protein n=1 Tax=Flavobacterium agrisoli TaxID=2793066 RepID=A0A934PJW4_9FLAO|nr:hypothetical protein [Flavobacterium agrisoli]MBK0368239.1 hypothetical protein [Flavobacterium agrisoli]
MKTFLVCTVLSFFLISCSDETQYIDESTGQSTDAAMPANGNNPYDIVGLEIYQKLNLYYEHSKVPTSVADLTAQLRFISLKPEALRNKNTQLINFTDDMVDSIMNDPDNSMIAIVQASSIGLYAKNNLTTFLQTLVYQRHQEFSICYDYITNYESEVLNDDELTTDETEAILTVASISRYSLYSAEERKDRDWETSVGSKPSKTSFTPRKAAIISIIALLVNILK